ncbi:hypothetical protein GN156_27095, partial [bacterium LRH843]|nr:hypothetical protein [bacterium LRH843]
MLFESALQMTVCAEVAVVDYGVGNIGSVLNMIKHVGGSATVVRDVK